NETWEPAALLRLGNNSDASASTCPLWVKSRHMQRTSSCPLYPRKRTFILIHARIRSATGRSLRHNVRLGSKADICSAKRHVRFPPNSDRESGFPQTVMSALPSKADSCSARAHVCYGPKADINHFSGRGGMSD